MSETSECKQSADQDYVIAMATLVEKAEKRARNITIIASLVATGLAIAIVKPEWLKGKCGSEK